MDYSSSVPTSSSSSSQFPPRPRSSSFSSSSGGVGMFSSSGNLLNLAQNNNNNNHSNNHSMMMGSSNNNNNNNFASDEESHQLYVANLLSELHNSRPTTPFQQQLQGFANMSSSTSTYPASMMAVDTSNATFAPLQNNGSIIGPNRQQTPPAVGVSQGLPRRQSQSDVSPLSANTLSAFSSLLTKDSSPTSLLRSQPPFDMRGSLNLSPGSHLTNPLSSSPPTTASSLNESQPQSFLFPPLSHLNVVPGMSDSSTSSQLLSSAPPPTLQSLLMASLSDERTRQLYQYQQQQLAQLQLQHQQQLVAVLQQQNNNKKNGGASDSSFSPFKQETNTPSSTLHQVPVQASRNESAPKRRKSKSSPQVDEPKNLMSSRMDSTTHADQRVLVPPRMSTPSIPEHDTASFLVPDEANLLSLDPTDVSDHALSEFNESFDKSRRLPKKPALSKPTKKENQVSSTTTPESSSIKKPSSKEPQVNSSASTKKNTKLPRQQVPPHVKPLPPKTKSFALRRNSSASITTDVSSKISEKPSSRQGTKTLRKEIPMTSRFNASHRPSRATAQGKSRISYADLDHDEEEEDDDDDDRKKTSASGTRRKINIEFIEDKIKRNITFSKRKSGIMKKAFELSVLTGTQLLLLVASETGHVFSFATTRMKTFVSDPHVQEMIQNCLLGRDQHESEEAGPLDDDDEEALYEGEDDFIDETIETREEGEDEVGEEDEELEEDIVEEENDDDEFEESRHASMIEQDDNLEPLFEENQSARKHMHVLEST